MRELTSQEIKFVKDTHFTPTVYQCDEYYKTPFKDYNDAFKCAQEEYNFNLDEFLDKNISADLDDADGISLEYVATYLLYAFFTVDELRTMSAKEALNWLQDYRYYGGFRKWSESLARIEILDAIGIHEDVNVLYETEDGNIWFRELGEDA